MSEKHIINKVEETKETLSEDTTNKTATPKTQEKSSLKALIALAYILSVFFAIIYTDESGIISQAKEILKDYIRPFITYFCIVYVAIAAIPYPILAVLGTSQEMYPSFNTKLLGESTFTIILVHVALSFQLSSLLRLPTYAVFYLYNCFKIGSITIVESIIAALFLYTCSYIDISLLYYFNVFFESVRTTWNVWKLMISQLQQNNNDGHIQLNQ